MLPTAKHVEVLSTCEGRGQWVTLPQRLQQDVVVSRQPLAGQHWVWGRPGLHKAILKFA